MQIFETTRGKTIERIIHGDIRREVWNNVVIENRWETRLRSSEVVPRNRPKKNLFANVDFWTDITVYEEGFTVWPTFQGNLNTKMIKKWTASRQYS